MNSFRIIAPIAYIHEIIKMPLAVSSRRVLKKNVRSATFANNANVESAERIVLFKKTADKKSPAEYVG